MSMSETSTLSTVIDSRVKKAVTNFCKKRGLKLRFLIEQALVEQIEDELDLQAYHERRNEQRISSESVISGIKKPK